MFVLLITFMVINMKNILIHNFNVASVFLSITGPPEKVISLLINLIVVFFGLVRAVQMLWKKLKTLDFGKIKDNLLNKLANSGVPGGLTSIPNFDTLGIRKLICDVKELYGRILSSMPKAQSLLKLISKLQEKIDHYLK